MLPRQAVRITHRNSGLVIRFSGRSPDLEVNLDFFTVAGAVLDLNEFPDSRVATHLKQSRNHY
jgi:hypothetical protein